MALRQVLRQPVPQKNPHALNFTSSATERTLAQAGIDRVRQQSTAQNRLANSDRLYRRRIEVLYSNDDSIRIYLSPLGEAFEAIEVPTSDEDLSSDVLVSWASPLCMALRDVEIGGTGTIGEGPRRPEVKVVSITEMAREEPQALLDFSVDDIESGKAVFAEVRCDNLHRGTITIRERTSAAIFEAGSEIVSELFPQSTTFGLGTVVRNDDGKAIEIPFALDSVQWNALRRHNSRGTVLLTGPPGTGKTTVALLRATALINASFQEVAEQQRSGILSDQRFMQKSSFRVVVVTEHLRTYLKETLSSSELALPDAQVVNIRNAFLETFVRHRTLKTWIHGVRFRLAPKANRISDALHFIKAMPVTLRLCFYHAVLNAKENAGPQATGIVQRIHDSVAARLEQEALTRILNEHDTERLKKQEQLEEFDLDEFLASIGKGNEFEQYLQPRLNRLATLERQFATFLQRWFTRAGDAVEAAIESKDETILRPGRDDLLLARFVDSFSFPEQGWGLRKTVVSECWRQLIRLVDPREVLLRVVKDLETTADLKELVEAGLSMEHAKTALQEWRTTLTGQDDSVADDEDEDGTLEELDELPADTDGSQKEDAAIQPKGAFTRSDFPLLAGMARVFLALPEEAITDPEGYKRVGFLLPDELIRYDHVIIDEGQDFTYAEIHLVRSLVESQRQAVTVSGDPFQRMDWKSGFNSLETIKPGADREFRVGRNYRQTAELGSWVHQLSKTLFGEDSVAMDHSDASGPPPKFHCIRELKEALNVSAQVIGQWYAEEQNPFAAVLMIGFEPGIQTRFANSLGKKVESDGVVVELIKDGRLIERGRVPVSDVPTIKGLEFDGVLVLVSRDTCGLLPQSTPQARVARNMLYVACSRAKRNLTVIFQEELPPSWSAELF